MFFYKKYIKQFLILNSNIVNDFDNRILIVICTVDFIRNINFSDNKNSNYFTAKWFKLLFEMINPPDNLGAIYIYISVSKSMITT